MMAAWIVTACLVSCARTPDPPDDSEIVVATVDGAGITLKDLKTEIARIRGVTPSAPATSGTRTEVSRALRQLVERAVVLREGERLGVSAGQAEVDDEIRRYRTDFPPGRSSAKWAHMERNIRGGWAVQRSGPVPAITLLFIFTIFSVDRHRLLIRLQAVCSDLPGFLQGCEEVER